MFMKQRRSTHIARVTYIFKNNAIGIRHELNEQIRHPSRGSKLKNSRHAETAARV